MHWYHYHQSVRRFATILRAADLLGDEDVYQEAPEDRDPEYRIWTALEHPEPPQGGLTTLAWERFVARSRRLRIPTPETLKEDAR